MAAERSTPDYPTRPQEIPHTVPLRDLADAFTPTHCEGAAGLRSWAEGQRRVGNITNAEHAGARALVARKERGGRGTH